MKGEKERKERMKERKKEREKEGKKERKKQRNKDAVVVLNKIWVDRGITKATTSHLVSVLIFPIATYDVKPGHQLSQIKKEKKSSILLNCGVGVGWSTSLGSWRDLIIMYFRRSSLKCVSCVSARVKY